MYTFAALEYYTVKSVKNVENIKNLTNILEF